MNLKDVIKKPIITEKTTEASALGKYAFEVDRKAGKREIIKAIEIFFGVHVRNFWSAKISPQRKKAVVQLVEGEKIDLFKTGE